MVKTANPKKRTSRPWVHRFAHAIGIGDDGAVQTLDNRNLVTVADMLLEGTHFDLEKCSPYEVGRKALAANLSDMAAMGAEPKGGLVSIGLPRQSSASFAEVVMTGVLDLADKFNVAIVGGDTNVWSGGSDCCRYCLRRNLCLTRSLPDVVLKVGDFHHW